MSDVLPCGIQLAISDMRSGSADGAPAWPNLPNRAARVHVDCPCRPVRARPEPHAVLAPLCNLARDGGGEVGPAVDDEGALGRREKVAHGADG